MRRRLEIALVVALAAGVLAAAVGLIAGRYLRGEAFPDGSSLSTAPGGAAALARALGGLDGIEVVRDLDGRELERCGAGCTLLVLGTTPHVPWSQETLVRVDARLRAGARIVLAFEPVEEDDTYCGLCRDRNEDDEVRTGDEGIDPPRPGTDEERPPPRAVAPFWWRELELELDAARDGGAIRFARRSPGAPTALPERVVWRSRLVLAELPRGAVRLYEVGAGAGAAEIPVGPGRLAIVSDGSLLTNLALRDRRETALVASLLGSPRRVVFEETHLGVHQQGGVAALARGYGLTPAAFALLGLALLYVWRSVAPLAPREPIEARVVEDGRDAYSGLVALLERGLGRRKVLSACVEAYRGTGSERVAEEQWQELERTARETEDPVEGYAWMRKTIGTRGG